MHRQNRSIELSGRSVLYDSPDVSCLMWNVFPPSRLVKAFTELDEYLKNELELKETKEYQAAAVVLSDAKEQMDNSL